MKVRLAAIAATLLLALTASACTTSNPVAPSATASPRTDDNGNWLGSGS